MNRAVELIKALTERFSIRLRIRRTRRELRIGEQRLRELIRNRFSERRPLARYLGSRHTKTAISRLSARIQRGFSRIRNNQNIDDFSSSDPESESDSEPDSSSEEIEGN